MLIYRFFYVSSLVSSLLSSSGGAGARFGAKTRTRVGNFRLGFSTDPVGDMFLYLHQYKLQLCWYFSQRKYPMYTYTQKFQKSKSKKISTLTSLLFCLSVCNPSYAPTPTPTHPRVTSQPPPSTTFSSRTLPPRAVKERQRDRSEAESPWVPCTILQ